MNSVQECKKLIGSRRFKKVQTHCLNCKGLKLKPFHGSPYDAYCEPNELFFYCEKRAKFDNYFFEIVKNCKRKKLFIASFALAFLLYFPTWTPEVRHHAFPESWKEYSYYFQRTAYHGVQGAERVFENGKVTYYFYNKRGERCVL